MNPCQTHETVEDSHVLPLGVMVMSLPSHDVLKSGVTVFATSTEKSSPKVL